LILLIKNNRNNRPNNKYNDAKLIEDLNNLKEKNSLLNKFVMRFVPEIPKQYAFEKYAVRTTKKVKENIIKPFVNFLKEVFPEINETQKENKKGLFNFS